MKKNVTLPDFHKLFFKKEEKHWQFYLSQTIFFFFFGAVCGFLWEVLIFLIKEGQFHKRGFLYGPWLPIYGVGAVLFYFVLGSPSRKNLLSDDILNTTSSLNFSTKKIPIPSMKKSHPLIVFLLSALLGGGIELMSGWILDTFWGLKYWNYDGMLLNFHGYICLYSVLGFGIAGMLWIGYVSAFLTKLWLRIPAKIRYGTNTILVLIFLVDCAAALIFPNQGHGITF